MFNTTISTLGSLAIVGVAVSLLVQFLKQHFGGGKATLAILVIISVIAGAAYKFFQAHTQLLADFVSILATANIVYNFVIQWFEATTPTSPATPAAPQNSSSQ